jgi:hypothetical protein
MNELTHKFAQPRPPRNRRMTKSQHKSHTGTARKWYGITISKMDPESGAMRTTVATASTGRVKRDTTYDRRGKAVA